ncbi:MAG TPA: hypothetical protein ENJ01_10305 [Gammaproteobacteria bacterium]|nr:hypothetical protein [Gammaproteobacteria bacterium]
MSTGRRITLLVAIVLLVFLAWRFIRPMNIFVVEDRFAWPVDTSAVPAVLGDLRAAQCGACHQEFYKEWQTTIHSQAWTDPYFQADWQFDDRQHICRLCHTPLDRQQPHKVLDYRDRAKWQPIMEDNPDFDAQLQHEGVTCAACHFRDGRIVGVLGDTDAPHPVKQLTSANEVCVRCHVVNGDSWDTFFRFPPCGTVAEIRETAGSEPVSGELSVTDIAALGCVDCHMPAVERPLVAGGPVRKARRHLWRGGHDPAMVKKALTVEFVERTLSNTEMRTFVLNIANTGAAHYVPTGTPDRHFSIQLRAVSALGETIEEEDILLKRHVMWRPFIVDLWDTRLPRGEQRSYTLAVPRDSGAMAVEAVVRYHLLDESRRQRIGYENTTPIAYEVFRRRITLSAGGGGQ